MFRRALEEGIVDPTRMIQAGIRGPLYGEADEGLPAQLGVETLSWTQLVELSPVDFVDAAFCPGTGTPEVGGPTSFQAVTYLRALTGIDFTGFDA